MKRTATAVWQGGLKEGKGTLSAPGGILRESAYSFATRFGSTPGTNPEELIAAAHAGCFTMALSGKLGEAGFTPTKLVTQATVTIELVQGNWTITSVHLDLRAVVPKIDQAQFATIAANAEANCPVSRVLNAEITLSSVLETA